MKVKICHVTACPYKCKKCAPNNDGVLECTACVANYGKNTAQCATCPANCVACDYDSGTMTCTKCAAMYTLVAGSCQSKLS